MYARDIVERTMRFGGSYYENSVHNKGPLEPGVYHLAALVSTYDSFWFAISAIIIGVSLVVGAAARRVVQRFGGPTWLGWAVFAAVSMHLTLSSADYAGVLYSRNMTIGLLCGAFLLLTGDAVVDGRSRHRSTLIVLAGACLGLAAQTLLTTAVSAAVVGAIGVANLGRARWLMISSAAVVFLSAPTWYLLRGSWEPFWNGWWVYGRYMSSALDRTLPEQFGLGWDQFYAYSLQHLPAHLCVFGFVLLGAVGWRQRSRAQRQLLVVLPVWWAAGWVEIILSQRYSSHYFIVTAVPLMLLCGAFATTLLGYLSAMLRARNLSVPAHSWVSYVLVAFSLVWTGLSPLRDGLEAAASFRGIDALARDRELDRAGTDRVAQAVIDVVSRPDDSMLTWTNEPWPFLEFRRVSATRFIWKSFLMGEVYLGPTSEEYVLPGSWEQWAADLRSAKPNVFLIQGDARPPYGTPAREALRFDFERVLSMRSLSVAVTLDVAAALRDRGADEVAPLPQAPGWSTTGRTWRSTPTGDDDPVLSLGEMECRRFDAVVGSGTEMTFRFGGATGGRADADVVLAGGLARWFESGEPVATLDAPLAAGQLVTVIVGRTVAIVLIDGKVVSGLNLLEHTDLSIVATGPLLLRGVGVGASPSGGQC